MQKIEKSRPQENTITFTIHVLAVLVSVLCSIAELLVITIILSCFQVFIQLGSFLDNRECAMAIVTAQD